MVMGLLLAMPFGPVNLLAMQRAVERGFLGGMAAGIGVMLGDGLIAMCAALGVNAVSGAIKDYRTPIQLIGGFALILAGTKLCFTKAVIQIEKPDRRATLWDHIGEVPQMFLLTITNPAAVLGLVAIFGGVSSFVEIDTYIDAFTMVAAIMGGSFVYWFLVSQFIATIRHRFNAVRLEQINRIAGLILIGFGCVLIGEMVVKRLRFW
ncbi:MAG: lysine transporter LysE [Hyphomicrobiales bacterium]|nr:MAG: lysine transporter LysE [Hyphomicrobiales bacterium]